MRAKFISDSKALLCGQVVELILGFATAIFLARILGPEKRGMLALVILLPMLVKTLLAGGFGSSVVYSVSSKKWREEDVISKLLGIWLSLSVVMLLIGGLVAGAIVWWSQTFSERLFFISLSLAPVAFGAECVGAVLSGKRRFADLAIGNIVSSGITLAMCISLVWGFELGVLGVIVAQLFGALIKIVVLGAFVFRGGGLNLRRGSMMPKFDLMEEYRYGLKSQAANIAAFLNYKLDQVLVMKYIGTSGLGVYSVAVNLAEKMWLVTNFIPKIVLSATAGADAKSQTEIALFVAKIARITLSCLCLGGLLFGFLSELLIVFLFGSDYRESATVIVWLLPGIVSFGYSRILANYLAGIGKPGLNAYRAIGSLIVNLILNIMWLPIYGVIGAAMATSVSYTLSALAGWILFSKYSGVSLCNSLIPNIDDFRSIWGAVNSRLLSK